MDKLFVSVVSDPYKDGSFVPRRICLPDGRAWNITRTLHISYPVAEEFEGVRYTVLIGNTEAYLYRTGEQWYVNQG